MVNVVFYHYPCPDGAFAALCASLFLTNVRWEPITVYEAEALRLARTANITKADDVYLLDYTGGVAFVEACACAAQAVYVLDHHKTAQEDCAPLAAKYTTLHLTIDMERSGCGIARDYFNAAAALQATVGEESAKRTLAMLDYVQDNDLWRHALADSKVVAAGVGDSGIEFSVLKNPALFQQLLAYTVPDMLAKGRAAQEKQDTIITAELATARALSIPDPLSGACICKALAVVTAYPEYRSVAGNTLAGMSKALDLSPVGIIAYSEAGLPLSADGGPLIKVSLRSLPGCDTTPWSKLYGGGGHANASSFNVPQATFDTWWI